MVDSGVVLEIRCRHLYPKLMLDRFGESVYKCVLPGVLLYHLPRIGREPSDRPIVWPLADGTVLRGGIPRENGDVSPKIMHADRGSTSEHQPVSLNQSTLQRAAAFPVVHMTWGDGLRHSQGRRRLQQPAFSRYQRTVGSTTGPQRLNLSLVGANAVDLNPLTMKDEKHENNRERPRP